MSDRVETGTVKFGDDWRCVVIRGDNAFGYANLISEAIAMLQHDDHAVIMVAGLRNLERLLTSADERVTAPCTQELKPFKECLK